MDLRAHRIEALVLRSIAYGDTDAVVQLPARGRGRIAAFVRGARTSRKRFGGALERGARKAARESAPDRARGIRGGAGARSQPRGRAGRWALRAARRVPHP